MTANEILAAVDTRMITRADAVKALIEAGEDAIDAEFYVAVQLGEIPGDVVDGDSPAPSQS